MSTNGTWINDQRMPVKDLGTNSELNPKLNPKPNPILDATPVKDLGSTDAQGTNSQKVKLRSCAV